MAENQRSCPPHEWASAELVCLRCGVDIEDYVNTLERQNDALRGVVEIVARMEARTFIEEGTRRERFLDHHYPALYHETTDPTALLEMARAMLARAPA